MNKWIEYPGIISGTTNAAIEKKSVLSEILPPVEPLKHIEALSAELDKLATIFLNVIRIVKERIRETLTLVRWQRRQKLQKDIAPLYSLIAFSVILLAYGSFSTDVLSSLIILMGGTLLTVSLGTWACLLIYLRLSRPRGGEPLRQKS